MDKASMFNINIKYFSLVVALGLASIIFLGIFKIDNTTIKKIYNNAEKDLVQIYNNAEKDLVQIYNNAEKDLVQIYNNAEKDVQIYNHPEKDVQIHNNNPEKEVSFQVDSSKNFWKTKARLDATHKHVVDVCKHSSYATIPSLQHWKPFAFGRLSVCAIAKVGTRFLSGVLNPTLKKIGDQTFQKENRKRFVLVREPYSRLVSAFFSKLVGHPDWWAVSKALISRYRQNASEISLRCGHDLTFPEFVKAVTDEHRHFYMKDRHMVRIMEVCNVCFDTPDFIGKLENVKEDMLYILDAVNVTGLTNSSYIEVNETARTFMKFKHKHNIKCGPACPILNRYWWVQQSNGLISLDIDMPLKGDQCENVTEDQLIVIAWTAHVQSVGRFNKNVVKRQAMADLYSQVPMEEKHKLKQLFSIECHLFGYDPEPAFVFPK